MFRNFHASADCCVFGKRNTLTQIPLPARRRSLPPSRRRRQTRGASPQHNPPGRNPDPLHQIILGLKLPVKRVLRPVTVEGRREVPRPQRLLVHRRDAEPPVEGIDHPAGGSLRRDCVQLIRNVVRVEGRPIYRPVVVEEEIPRWMPPAEYPITAISSGSMP